MPPTPPRVVRWIVSKVLPPGVRGATVLGDLAEDMNARATRTSPRRAAWWYRRAALDLAVHQVIARWRGRASRDRSARRKAPLMDLIRVDARYALRSLAKARGFTAAVLATLTIGIGASTAIFSVVHAMLLRPLPYPDSDRLMWAAETRTTGSLMTVSWPNFLDWRTRVTSFEDLAGSRGSNFTLKGVGQAARLDSRQVTWNFFSVLKAAPALGRLFTAADDAPSAVHPVVVSHGFWLQYLGGDSGAIGRRVMLDAEPHEIVGVLKPGFRYVLDYAAYEPIGVMTTNESFLNRGNHQGIFAIGLLKPGVTEGAARGELQAVATALAREYPNTNSGQGAHLQTLASRIVGPLQPALVALLAAVGLLLLIACVNVVNLSIARGVTRRPELSVRAALGCGRARLMGQLLVESLLLAAAGGALGLVAGWGLLNVLVPVAPANLPRLDEVRLDPAVLLFAGGMTVVTGLIVGLLPAIHASKADGQALVVRAGRSGAPGSRRLRSGLLVVEVALALVLLAGAGLMARTMRQLTGVDPGFSPDHLLTLRYSIERGDWTNDRVLAFHGEMLSRARAIPGVTNAALALSLPIEGSQWGSVFMVGDRPAPPRAELPSGAFSPVSPEYFETLGLRLRAGRVFDATDTSTSLHVSVVNETFARRFWPNQNPIGQTLKQGWPEWTTPWLTIVGVVNDIKLDGVSVNAPLQIYQPLTQQTMRSMAMIVRTTGDHAGPAAALAHAVADLDKDLPIYSVQTMDELMSGAVSRERLSMVILAVFAVIAVILASVGLYGVASQGVSERTREVGVRMALGANRRQIIALFLRHGVLMISAGIAIGVLGALTLARFLTDLLFQVEPGDPITLAAVAVLLFVVGLAACYVPARRATRVSPTVALRGD